MQRGKFRPRLTEMVNSNGDVDVKTISMTSLKLADKPEAAIKELNKLKAVGPATASGV